ncbi:putative membrane protein [Actinokineospora auranticolor]|uniref:Putative membrane protein n=1 Tax=Actinokineospora auranticolor TaxID=155976 RepID=A0A2S6GS76_9PSEU|nr:putative membrane protein [Actinokineospora auranticolor]
MTPRPDEVESPAGAARAPEAPGDTGPGTRESASPSGVSDTDSLDPDERVRPSWSESLARNATRPLGGPLGEHAVVGRHWFWTPLRVGLLLALLALVVSWFGKSACVQQYDTGDKLALDWRSSRPYVAMCYSDIVPLYTAERLDKPETFPYETSWVDDEGKPTAHTRYMEYPVVTGMFQWVNAKITAGWVTKSEEGWLPTALPVVIYFSISAFWLALAWLVTVWCTGRTARHRPWDAAFIALSPLVLVHAFTNFDTLATACAAGALLAWSRKKPVLAGVLLGLGIATKLYPLFLLGPLLILCLRTGRMKAWWQATAGAVVTWLACNLWLILLYPEGWAEFFRLNSERGADPDSLYNVVMKFTGWEGFDGPLPWGESPQWLNLVSAALFVVLCAGIAYIGLQAVNRPRLAQLSFLVVSAFLLTNKVWSPQYSLWLVPLAVLALPRWKLLLAWMTIDALVWAPRMMYYLGENNKGLPEEWFLGMVVLRDLAVIGLCVLVIYEIYHPALDRARRRVDEDPGGGVFEDAPDKFVIGGRKPRSGTVSDHDDVPGEPVPAPVGT